MSACTPSVCAGAVQSRVSTNEKLRAELLEMMARDQTLRGALGASQDSELVKQLLETDAVHTARFKEILHVHGWPSFSLVGNDGAQAAWIVAQHADADRNFQRNCLELMRVAVNAGEADAQLLAYLTDRVRVALQQPQVYGTQMRVLDDGHLEPFEIGDADRVDERRAEIGLESMVEYRKKMQP